MKTAVFYHVDMQGLLNVLKSLNIITNKCIQIHINIVHREEITVYIYSFML